MKTLIAIIGLAALSACAHGPKPPRVELAPIGQNFDRIDNQADRLDALATKMETQGQ